MDPYKLSLDDFDTALRYLTGGGYEDYINKNVRHLHKEYLNHINCGMCPHEK